MKTSVLTLSAVVLLVACGQAGDLYLPEPRERPQAQPAATPAPTTGDEQPNPQQLEGGPDEDAESPSSPADPTPTPSPSESP